MAKKKYKLIVYDKYGISEIIYLKQIKSISNGKKENNIENGSEITRKTKIPKGEK